MYDATPQGLPAAESDRRHELRDVSLRGILIAAGGLVAIALTLHLALWGLIALFNANPEKPEASLSPLAKMPREAPSPRLQNYPPRDMAEFRAKEDAELNGYGWADRPAGRVRVPIDAAKDLFIQENMQTNHAQGQPPFPAGSLNVPAGGALQ